MTQKETVVNKQRFRYIRSEDAIGTRELAQHFLDMPSVKGERKIKPKRLEALANEIGHGFLREWDWAVCLCHENGLTFRINGQHSSTLITQGRVPDDNPACIKHFEAETIENLNDLWSIVDSKISSRDKREVLNAIIMEDPDLERLRDDPLLLNIHGALSLVEFGSGHTETDRETARAIHKHKDFILWCFNIMEGETLYGKPKPFPKPFRKNGVQYAMFITYNWNPDLARIFWREVVTGRGEPDTGSRLLHDQIKHKGIAVAKGSVQWYMYTNYCLHAHKVWDEKRTMCRLRVDDKGLKNLNRFISQGGGKIYSFHPKTKSHRKRAEDSSLPDQLFDGSVEEATRIVMAREKAKATG